MENKIKVLNIEVGHERIHVTKIDGHEYMVASNEQEVTLKGKRIVNKKYSSMRKGWDKESSSQKDPKGDIQDRGKLYEEDNRKMA